MNNIEKICKAKEQELLDKYFGNLAAEAGAMTDSIGEYTLELPAKVEAEYCEFLAPIWAEHAAKCGDSRPFSDIIDEQKLRELITEGDRSALAEAHKEATTVSLWEKITNSNHEDVTHYKGLLNAYTKEVLYLIRVDFLEEVTGRYIEGKAFEK